jgi:hypothetical protein
MGEFAKEARKLWDKWQLNSQKKSSTPFAFIEK